MLDELVKILKNKGDLTKQAQQNAIRMLEITREMFDASFQGFEDPDMASELPEKIKEKDKKINKLHRETKKMITEHLLLSKGEDLLFGLKLSTIIDNLERIGDYEKNISELASRLGEKPAFGKYHNEYKEVLEKTSEIYKNTIDAFSNENSDTALCVMESFGQLADQINDRISSLFDLKDDEISKQTMGFMLVLRYLKRINSHLKTICTSIVNPFHKMGYKGDHVL